MNLAKSFTLITGASSGIGHEMAQKLAAMGHNLILVARRQERLDALKQLILRKYNVQVEVLPADLGTADSAQTLYDEVRARGLHVATLVNNAGFGLQGLITTLSPSRLNEMMQLNVVSLTLLTRLFVDDMIKRGAGHIVNVASVAGFFPIPYFSVYAATKAFVRSFGEALYFEVKPHGVAVTNVYPGTTLTEFFDALGSRPKTVTNLTAMTGERVAELAVRAMQQRRRRVVTGWSNTLNVMVMRLFPDWLSSCIAGTIFKKVFQRAN